LLNLQTNINIKMDSLTIDALISKYTVNILKLKKQFDSWPKDLIGDWSTRSK
jgi:hypothetical protein